MKKRQIFFLIVLLAGMGSAIHFLFPSEMDCGDPDVGWFRQGCYRLYKSKAEHGDSDAMLVLYRLIGRDEGEEQKREALFWLNQALMKKNIQAVELATYHCKQYGAYKKSQLIKILNEAKEDPEKPKERQQVEADVLKYCSD